MTIPVSLGRPDYLPDYGDPPVDEVAIGVAFMPVTGFSNDHVARYRNRVKGDFPALQYQPRMAVRLESLTQDPLVESPFGQMIRDQLTRANQRTWFVSADDQRVLQIQEDAFIANWRRRAEPYPRFESILKEFWSRFQLLREEVSVGGESQLQLQQLDVTYINWVPSSARALSDWFSPARASRIKMAGTEINPEHELWAVSYLINRNGIPTARLHGRQMEALRTSPGPHVGAQLELAYRAPLAPGISDDEINELAFHAREVIVLAFTDLTTKEAHDEWGLHV